MFRVHVESIFDLIQFTLNVIHTLSMYILISFLFLIYKSNKSKISVKKIIHILFFFSLLIQHVLLICYFHMDYFI